MFYGAVFKPIDDIIAANAAHNRMVKLIARKEGAPLIDMAASVDGVWDDDLYLDIVHFTEAGNERVAGLMFKALLPSRPRARGCAANCAKRRRDGRGSARSSALLSRRRLSLSRVRPGAHVGIIMFVLGQRKVVGRLRLS